MSGSGREPDGSPVRYPKMMMNTYVFPPCVEFVFYNMPKKERGNYGGFLQDFWESIYFKNKNLPYYYIFYAFMDFHGSGFWEAGHGTKKTGLWNICQG